ncbi:MAG TPA: hypothetical protein VMH28_07620 [Candidatus Acidoferrales bacterium]|nr:hypothetical protein [Candidatus Acidoferrales bacterium]
MIDTLLNLVFRCSHRRLTRPVTPVTKGDVPHGPTYVVCLDCGKQFSYDVKAMRIGKPIDPAREAGVAPAPASTNSFSRIMQAMIAGIPAAIVFCLALIGLKRAGSGRERGDAPGGR